jgi:hypothetical protein
VLGAVDDAHAAAADELEHPVAIGHDAPDERIRVVTLPRGRGRSDG